MKIIFLNLLLIFSFCFSQGQKINSKITCDYLTGFERWKLILHPDSTFILTTNLLFRPDTSISGTGTFLRTDTSVQFLCDTSTVKERYLFETKYSNEQNIVQSGKFNAKNEVVHFKNIMRVVYDTSKFSDNVLATYYRGDGKWAFFITLMDNKTYKISESVHGYDEHTETGKWFVKNEKIKFKLQKGSSRLAKFGDPGSFYFSYDFLIGRKKTGQGQETHYYFVKVPNDWY